MSYGRKDVVGMSHTTWLYSTFFDPCCTNEMSQMVNAYMVNGQKC